MFRYRCYCLVERGKKKPFFFLFFMFVFPVSVCLFFGYATGLPLKEFSGIPGILSLALIILMHEAYEEKINKMKPKIKRWSRSE